MKLVFLGRFRDLAAPRLGDMVLPEGVRTLAQLGDWLSRSEPELADALTAPRTQIAVNHVIVRDPGHPITNADEIAFLPPMSGG